MLVETWIHHPECHDLSVAPICEAELMRGKFEWTPLSQNRIVTRDIQEQYRIGIGDDTISMGRFVPADAIDRHQPVVRFGRISSMPVNIYQSERQIEQESFLVECWSYSGYSGAPVLVDLDRSTNKRRHDTTKEEKAAYPDDPFIKNFEAFMGIWLLGVNWGHTSDVVVLQQNEKRDLNTGLMCVVPGWRLADLLESDECVSTRNEYERQVPDRLNPI